MKIVLKVADFSLGHDLTQWSDSMRQEKEPFAESSWKREDIFSP